MERFALSPIFTTSNDLLVPTVKSFSTLYDFLYSVSRATSLQVLKSEGAYVYKLCCLEFQFHSVLFGYIFLLQTVGAVVCVSLSPCLKSAVPPYVYMSNI